MRMAPYVSLFMLVALAALSASCVGARMSGPDLVVSPQSVLAGDPIQIRVLGLHPGQSAVLGVSGVDQYGQTWQSSATYGADRQGHIDVATQAPSSGSYVGVSPAGLFWSMAPDATAKQVTPMVSLRDMAVSLNVDNHVVETRRVELKDERDLQIERLDGEVKGYFCTPKDIAQRRPALVVVGGSEGGSMKWLAANLASRLRHPVLALQYFNLQSNPPTFLENIPIETMQRAFAWLNAQPTVQADAFVLYGVSRGSELVFLSAALFPDQVKGVVGNVPSAYVWQGLGPSQGSAWSWQGKPLPFIPVTMDAGLYQEYLAAQHSGEPFAFTKVHRHSLAVATQAQLQEARIPLERAKAAILLISSEADGVWMSSVMAGTVADHLRAQGYAHGVTHLSWPASGHIIVHGYQPTTVRKMRVQEVWMDLGGTAAGTAQASDESWYALMGFFRSVLARL